MQRRSGRVGDDAVVVAVAFVDVEARQEPVAASDGAFDGLANSATVGGGQGELDRRKAQTLDLQKNASEVGTNATILAWVRIPRETILSVIIISPKHWS